MQYIPQMQGEALYVPRIEPVADFALPTFRAMGLLLGPSTGKDELRAAVTGTVAADNTAYALNHYYQRLKDPTDNWYQVQNVTELPIIDHDQLQTMAEPWALTLPCRDGHQLDRIVHVPLPMLDVFFEDERVMRDPKIGPLTRLRYRTQAIIDHKEGKRLPMLGEGQTAGALVTATKSGTLAMAAIISGSLQELRDQHNACVGMSDTTVQVAHGAFFGTYNNRRHHFLRTTSPQLTQIALPIPQPARRLQLRWRTS